MIILQYALKDDSAPSTCVMRDALVMHWRYGTGILGLSVTRLAHQSKRAHLVPVSSDTQSERVFLAEVHRGLTLTRLVSK